MCLERQVGGPTRSLIPCTASAAKDGKRTFDVTDTHDRCQVNEGRHVKGDLLEYLVAFARGEAAFDIVHIMRRDHAVRWSFPF